MDSLFVIHIGAGRHSTQRSKKYKLLLKTALRKGNFVDASRIIENSVLTNTGYGSSVDRTGVATSDACVLEIENCRIVNSLTLLNIYDDAYPTACVHKVLRDLEREYSVGSTNRNFGLSKPSLLDYKMYSEYLDRNPDFASGGLGKEVLVSGHNRTTLVLRKNSEAHEKFRAIFRGQKNDSDGEDEQTSCSENSDSPAKRRKKVDLAKCERLSDDDEYPSISPNSVEDTVGYIEISETGKTTSAASSGGNFYRVPGRVSCAGIMGAGIGYSSHEKIEISCMCSGNGDDIITMNLASYLSESIARTLAATEEWPELGPLLESCILRKSQQVVKTAVDGRLQEITYVGVVLIVRSPTTTRLVFCHSTESFYFGFKLHGKVELVLSHTNRPLGQFLHGEYKL